MPTAPTRRPAARSGRPRLGAAMSLALLGSVLVMFLAASSVPSPLYDLYRVEWHFSSLMMTAVFAVYAFTLLAALLLFGRLSDHVGRRPVVLCAIVLEIVSIVLFHQADSVGWLMAARALQGFATGIATSTLSAALIDCDQDRGALVNSVAPMIGMGIGSLGSGLLVQFAASPMTLPYEWLLVVLSVQGVATWFVRETVAPMPGAWASMRPQVAIPPQARRTFAQILPVNTAQWALGGFYLSLGPSLARVVTGSQAPVLGGVLIATLVIASAVAITLVRKLPPGRVLRGGTSTLTVGLVITLAGVHWQQGILFFAGTAIAGLGFGAAFNGAMRNLVPLAQPHERGGLMSSFFVLSYLAFSLPALAAGLAVGPFGLPATAMVFGAVLVLMCLSARVAMGAATPGRA